MLLKTNFIVPWSSLEWKSTVPYLERVTSHVHTPNLANFHSHPEHLQFDSFIVNKHKSDEKKESRAEERKVFGDFEIFCASKTILPQSRSHRLSFDGFA